MKLIDVVGLAVAMSVAWQRILEWLAGSAAIVEPEVLMGLPVAAGLALAGGGGLLGGLLGGKKKTTRETPILTPRSDIFNFPGFGFLGGQIGPETAGQQADFIGAINQLLQTAGGGGLPQAVGERGRANIASGFQNAAQAAGRTAALGFGPSSLSPAIVEASRGRAAAQFEGDLSLQDLQAQLQQSSLLQGLLNFFGQIESARLGGAGREITQPGNRLGGILQGAGIGSQLAGLFGGGGGSGEVPNGGGRF